MMRHINPADDLIEQIRKPDTRTTKEKQLDIQKDKEVRRKEVIYTIIGVVIFLIIIFAINHGSNSTQVTNNPCSSASYEYDKC